ncbi:MAG: DUF1566 domain-containing protein [Myxococcaceae bacterium]|nr:DUF1566 domain-containing protein [Myxococcaceae bacterium]MBH2005940.1 DUF1566 domain-containing protein [Myxococcaceae bacterium]
MNRYLCSWLLLLSLPVQAGFVLREGFSEVLSQQFSNLTQLKNQTSSLSKELVTQNAMRGLWSLIGPHLQALPGCCKKPFSSNCSVFFDAEIDEVVCDAQFEEVQAISTSCEAEQRFPVGYLAQLHKSNILQTRIVVGLAPVQHPQVMYWLYDKLPPTLSQSVTQSNSMSGRNTQTGTDSASPMNSTTDSVGPTSSFTESLLSSRSVSFSSTATESLTPSHSVATESANLSHSLSGSTVPCTSESLSHSQTLSSTQYPSFSSSLSPSAPVVWNPEWADWQVTTGVYRDNANQTGRYFESVPGVITDQMTGLQWQKVGSASAGNWIAAQAYCTDLFESGFGDWRLPTHVELQTLVDYTISCAGPSVDLGFFPGTQTSSYYWSSDALQGYPGSAWWVSYGSGAYYAGLVCSQGYSGCSSAPASGFARCVRSSSAVREVNRYAFNSTQVLDTVTGLIWQRTVSGTYNWGAAQAYCAGLNLDGLSWRLPNVKELSTLLDVRVAYPGPTINTTVFPSTPQSGFWTSTPYSCVSSSNAWLVGFDCGYVIFNGLSPAGYVRCVRSPQVYNPEWANWQVTTGVYQDSANQTGRYLESVPGVITDQMTGLQWQKVESAPAGNWTAAQAYCANLFESGFGDWRLPTHVELQTLADYTISCAGPSVDPDFFPGTQTSSYYWSSDALQGYPGSAWWVSYGSGAYYAGLVCSQGYGGCTSVPASGFTRCVRPSSAVREVDRYTFNSTQVLDTVTGLIWQRTVSGNYNWGAAQAYCAGLNLDGLSWRLPNVKELSTLLDVHVAYPGPTINTTVFPGTPQAWFWTSTPYSCASPSGAWGVDFGNGGVFTVSISNTYYVRCVR